MSADWLGRCHGVGPVTGFPRGQIPENCSCAVSQGAGGMEGFQSPGSDAKQVPPCSERGSGCSRVHASPAGGCRLLSHGRLSSPYPCGRDPESPQAVPGSRVLVAVGTLPARVTSHLAAVRSHLVVSPAMVALWGKLRSPPPHWRQPLRSHSWLCSGTFSLGRSREGTRTSGRHLGPSCWAGQLSGRSGILWLARGPVLVRSGVPLKGLNLSEGREPLPLCLLGPHSEVRA